MIGRILDRAIQLEQIPYSGSAVSDYPQDDVLELLERPYRIIYKIGAGRIDVLTVMHYRQLLPGP